MSWTECSKNKFNVDFDRYDLEIQLSGSKQLDIHNNHGGSDKGFIQFTLDSSSSSFTVSHMCDGGTISNVPTPASNTRTWKIKKSSSYVYIYCSGVLVGKFSRSGSWSCLSDDRWNNFGSQLYFYSDSAASKYYRLVNSGKIIMNYRRQKDSSETDLARV